MATIRIEKHDMEAFAIASGDFNPIHLEGTHVSEDPFEAPVAYGALAALIAVGKLTDASDRGLQILDLTFARPLRVGAEYDIEVRRDPASRVGVCIRDGDLPALMLEARFSGSGVTALAVGGAERLSRPLRRPIEELEADSTVQGSYGIDEASLSWIRERFRLRPSAVDDRALHALLFASYLVGMVIPGSGSMMSRLRVSLSDGGTPRGRSAASQKAPLSYLASVVDLRRQVCMVTLAGELRHAEQSVAKLTCEAYLPPPSAPLDTALLESELGGKSNALGGRTAIVVGASRGLGAALAHGLASQGCSVYACSRSGEECEPLAAPSWKSAIRHVRGDASDPDHCQRLLEQVEDRHGGLDFVLCCAAPQLGGIGFGPTPARRFNSFIQESVELVSVPMATMIHAVEAKKGACLVVSSEAVKTMPRDWGHYVAAKGATEALAAWVAKRFPRLEMVVARVPQLYGSQLGIGGDGAVRREAAAAWLVRRLMTRSGAGAHLLEWPGRFSP